MWRNHANVFRALLASLGALGCRFMGSFGDVWHGELRFDTEEGRNFWNKLVFRSCDNGSK